MRSKQEILNKIKKYKDLKEKLGNDFRKGFVEKDIYDKRSNDIDTILGQLEWIINE